MAGPIISFRKDRWTQRRGHQRAGDTETMRTQSFDTSYLALPAGTGPHPGVVVIHEASGLNDNIRGICRRFAAEGYAALGVDLFEGRNRAACMARMFIGGMAGNLNYYGVPALKAALGRLAGHPEVDANRIGAIGFCLGGSIVLTWACTDGRLAAIAPFYGAAPRPREGHPPPVPGRRVMAWQGHHHQGRRRAGGRADRRRYSPRPEDLPGSQALLLQRPVAQLPPRRRSGLLAPGPGLLRRARPEHPGSRLSGGSGPPGCSPRAAWRRTGPERGEGRGYPLRLWCLQYRFMPAHTVRSPPRGDPCPTATGRCAVAIGWVDAEA
jgi:dienelactone hydrolase